MGAQASSTALCCASRDGELQTPRIASSAPLVTPRVRPLSKRPNRDGDADKPANAALARLIEDMQSQMEQHNQDSLEQQRVIENLHSEIDRLRRTNAELESEVDWARLDALELHYREVHRSRVFTWGDTEEDTKATPELSKFTTPKMVQFEGDDELSIDPLVLNPRPAVFEAFLLSPPCSSRLNPQEECGRGPSCSTSSSPFPSCSSSSPPDFSH